MKPAVKMIVVLGLISAISSGLLAGVNMLTKDTIATNSDKELNKSLAKVIDADEFEKQEETELALWHALKNGELAGYVVRLTGKGYSSAGIDILVGMDSRASVTGVLVFSHSETPGLGSKVAEPRYLAQFVGKGIDSPFATGEDVDAISGATSSSKAVIGSVRKAVEFVGEYAGLSNNDKPIDISALSPGKYTGTAMGYTSEITVEVTVAEGKVTEITIVSQGDSPEVAGPAFEAIIAAIKQEQSLEVDLVSGATFSSEGLIAAVKDALIKAGPSSGTGQ